MVREQTYPFSYSVLKGNGCYVQHCGVNGAIGPHNFKIWWDEVSSHTGEINSREMKEKNGNHVEHKPEINLHQSR